VKGKVWDEINKRKIGGGGSFDHTGWIALVGKMKEWA